MVAARRGRRRIASSVAFAADVFNSRWDPTVDLDGDNFISGIDLALMAAQFAVSCP